jgi:hypothetical protein
MSNSTDEARKDSGPLTATVSIPIIARADRAYHDVAQLHLHEFCGGESA